ncbi:MAG: Gldg family protein [Planctomycetota bacterium]|jgi:ABC-2 type transport system permease protein
MNGFADLLFGSAPVLSFQGATEVGLRLLLVGILLFYARSAQFRRELLSLFVSPSTYVVIVLFVVILSLLFYLLPLAQGYCALTPMFSIVVGLQILFAPLLTMRMFSEEWRQGTLELVLTSPVSLWELIAAKYVTALAFFLVMLSPMAIYGGILLWAGNLDGGATLAGVLGMVLVGVIYSAVGIFASAINRNQISAAMLSMLILFVMFFLGDPKLFSHPLWRWFSFVPHLMPIVDEGVVSLEAVTTVVAQAGFFLILTRLVLGSRHAFGGMMVGHPPRHLLRTGLLLAVVVEAALFGYAYSDVAGISVLGGGEGASHAELGMWRWIPLSAYGLSFIGLLLLLIHRVQGSTGFLNRQVLGQGAMANSLASLFLVVAVLVNVCWLAGALGGRSDFTDRKLNTLNPVTLDALGRLQQSLVVKVFFSPDNRYDGQPLLQETSRLLAEFSAANDWVTVEYVDPDRNLVRARDYAKTYGIEFSQLAAVMILSYGDQRSVIPWEYLVPEQTNPLGRKVRQFVGETVLVSTLNRLLDPRRTRICFTEGRGEYDPFHRGDAMRKAGLFVKEMRISGFEVQRLLLGKEGIPKDCDLLVMVGPLLPLGARELTHLEAFVDRGGSLLLLVDPMAGEDDHLQLEPFLRKRGVALGQDTLLQPTLEAQAGGGDIEVQGNAKHPITQAGSELKVKLRKARSLSIRRAEDHIEGWEAVYLLKTGRKALSLPNAVLRGRRPSGASSPSGAGALGCAAALTGPNGGRCVVVGDADLMGNLMLGEGHNRLFLRSSVLWLLNREYGVHIPSREDEDRRLTLSPVQRRVTFWVVLVAVPQAFVLMGLLVWWCRRA